MSETLQNLRDTFSYQNNHIKWLVEIKDGWKIAEL